MYFLTDTKRPGSHEYAHSGCRFRKGDACLMAMSYSYQMHAKVFECMAVLAAKQAEYLLTRKIGSVISNGYGLTMSSRKMAGFYAETYSPEKSGQLVKSSTYTDSTGRELPCFELDKQASLDLVTGYSLPHRHAVNKRWQELE